jgi:hypothetical protein
MPRFRAGLIAGGATLIALAGPVAAAHADSSALTPTRVVLSPATQSLSYGSPTVTIKGTLETVVPAGSTPQGVPGELVSLALEVDNESVSIPLATATTGATGQFDVTTTVPSPGVLEATFAGDSTYAAGKGSGVLEAEATLPARFVFNAVQPSPVYSTLTATGQLQMQAPGGSWVAAPYAPLRVVQGSDVTSASDWTDADGDFSATFQVNPEFPLQLWTAGGGSFGSTFAAAAFSTPLIVPLTTFPTEAELSTGPKTQDLRHMSFGGTVDYVNAQNQSQPLAGATTELCYEPAFTTTCIPRAAATSDASGNVTFSHVSGYLPGGKLALSSGMWYMNVQATPAYLASSGSNWVWTYVPVWLNDVRVTHAAKRAYLTGVLDDDYRSGPVAGQRVTISWDHGRRKATARTGGNGEFSFKLTGRPAGVYEVTYSGGTMTGGAFIPATAGEHARVTYKP